MIKDILSLLVKRKEFFSNLLFEHLQISIISILIAIIIGLFIGILISEYRKTSKLSLGVINIIYTIPSISLFGFLIPFSGVGNTTAIIALTIYALLPMVRNTYTSIVNIDKNILEAAKGMGSTRLQMLFKIKLPLAMPIIISGIRNMVTMTVALAGIASFIGAGGLGVAIYRGITTNNTIMTIAGSLLIAILAIGMDIILGILEKHIGKRQKNKKKSKTLVIIMSVVLFIIVGGKIWSSSSKSIINIATKPMTEQYIMGEILNTLIEQDTDLEVKVTQGVGGGTSNIEPAMEKGEFDIYPEYTGTGWNMVLKKDGIYDENMFNKLQKEYKEKLDFSWIGMYGFNNTYGIAVRREIAEKYNLRTYSDLAKISDKLNFGAEYDFFEREDGYDALCKKYDLSFNKTVDLDIGVKYKSIKQKKVDVMSIFTTDGQLSVVDVVILKDDKKLYPSYLCGNVVRREIIKEYPELKSVFKKLEGLIDDKTITKMNYTVENKGKEPKEVAMEFLKKKELLN